MEALRRWVNHVQVDSGVRPGVSSEESQEIRRLRRENAELRRANEILKAASAFLSVSGRRPPHGEMIQYIGLYKDRFGVRLICRTMGATEVGLITSRGYLAAKTCPSSERQLRDNQLIPVLEDRHFKAEGPNRLWVAGILCRRRHKMSPTSFTPGHCAVKSRFTRSGIRAAASSSACVVIRNGRG